MSAIQTPFSGFTTEVKEEWIDYNGHMNVGYYLVAFDMSVKVFLDWLGLTDAFKQAHGSSTFALETHLNYMKELSVGETIHFETRLLDYDHKRFHFYQEMFHTEQGYRAATHESLGAYIDMSVRKTAAIPPDITTRLEQVMRAHETLPVPWQVGHKIGIRK